ncbi:MAG: glycosyltransferase family 4 protein [Planctomycetota bacterium]
MNTRRPVRVLVLGAALAQPMGGVRRHNAELLPRLAARLQAHGGELVILEGATPLPFALPRTIQRLASPVPATPALWRVRAETRALGPVLAAARARGAPFDLVHTGHLPVPKLTGLSAQVPLTVTIHDLRRLERKLTSAPERFLARKVLDQAVRRARSVITVSETMRAALEAQLEVERARIAVVPNAADHLTPLPREQTLGAPLLYVGHLEPRKNLDLLLRALQADPGLPTLWLAGRTKGREAKRLEELAVELGVFTRVRFLGAFEEDQLPRLYAQAACVVLPARIEGFGIPALEALRARVPLCVARGSALTEVAAGAPDFSPDDPVECAAKIRTALSASPAQLEAAAERANAYSWDRSADAWLEACYAAARA